MICNYCGTETEDNAKFCPFCGQALNSTDKVGHKSTSHASNRSNKNSQGSSSAFYQNPNKNSTQKNSTPVLTQAQKEEILNKSRSYFSLILGILSIVLVSLPFFSLLLGIAGIVFFFLCKKKNGLNISGLISSIIGTILSVVFLAFILYFIFETKISGTTEHNVFSHEETMEDNTVGSDNGYKYLFGYSFQLPYDSSWTLSTIANGKSCICYTWNETICFISSIGESPLPATDIDYHLEENQKKLYDEFRQEWNQINNHGTAIMIWNESYGFIPLNSDILYAYYDFGTDENSLIGRYYLLMDIEKNALLSFVVSNPDNSESFYTLAESVLRNIIISEDAFVEEENLNAVKGILDSQQPWNMYADLRTGEIAKIPVLEGNWRILSNSETFYEFKGNEFWWYKSYNDLNDNYWYGETEILKGKEGIDYAGLNPNAIDNIFKKSNGEVEYSDIYTIVCKPSKIISGGIDKSDTNIEEGLEWILCWIVIDHGEEGIEGQVLNVSNGANSSYVKMSD